MMANKYGIRPVVMENKGGQRQLVSFDFSTLQNMDLKTSIDVGETSYWSEISAMQTMDNLLASERIEFIDYLERMPNEFIPKKAELIAKIKESIQEQQALPGGNNDMYEQMAQYMDTLPIEQQQAIRSLPPDQMEQRVAEMMQQA
jgi:hypothetical protein